MKTRLSLGLLSGFSALLLIAGCGNGQGGAATTSSTASPATLASTAATQPASASPSASPSADAATPSPAASSGATTQVTPQYTAQKVAQYPHDINAFTEGLQIESPGVFLESTGLEGKSNLRRVDLKTGKVEKQVDLPVYFGEGITRIGDSIYQLTWTTHKGFVYEADTFKKTGSFIYAGEGWGLTNDGKQIIMSDGTNKIKFIDPDGFKVVRTISVTDAGEPVANLNELEYIKGEIWANVWQQDYLVRIDPKTGNTLGWVDCMGLLPASERTATTDVLNGIAYDASQDKIYVTGKLWPHVYEIKVTPQPATTTSAAPAK